MIIVNNVNSNPQNMGGNNDDIRIPSVMVSMLDGSTIKQNIKASLATLSFDATMKEALSSFLGLPTQCNRVRSPSFLLRSDSSISIWVSFDIKGVTYGFQSYDRANIGLFNGKNRVTLSPDGGVKYNSNDEVETIGTCPSPGDNGWRENSGPVFKKVVFSSKALQDANMIGQMVQLDIALATGLMSYGSFFSIQKITLDNVGLPVTDNPNGLCAMPSEAPSRMPIYSESPSQEPSLTSSESPSQEPSLKSSPEPSSSRSQVPSLKPSDTTPTSERAVDSSIASSSKLANTSMALVVVVVFGILTFIAIA